MAVLLLLVVAAVSRLIPHIPNFTPTEGLALFGAAYLSRKYLAFLLPVLMLYFTDLVLNNTINRIYFTGHEGLVLYSDYMLYNFIAMGLIVILGSILLRKISFLSVFGSALGASVIFFLVSNFGVWISSTFYPKNVSGLAATYIAGWPFFKTTLLSNVIFTTLFFGTYELFKSYLVRVERSKTNA